MFRDGLGNKTGPETNNNNTTFDSINKLRMKVFALTLASLILSQYADGFSVISRTGNPKSAPRCVQLAAHKNHNLLNADFVKRATSFAAAVALGWGVASGASVAATLPVMYPSLPLESSSVTVSIGEYADFSMPSYRAAVDAPVMTNLIGGDKMVANPFGNFDDSTAR
jgi:hypothetical protein